MGTDVMAGSMACHTSMRDKTLEALTSAGLYVHFSVFEAAVKRDGAPTHEQLLYLAESANALYVKSDKLVDFLFRSCQNDGALPSEARKEAQITKAAGQGAAEVGQNIGSEDEIKKKESEQLQKFIERCEAACGDEHEDAVKLGRHKVLSGRCDPRLIQRLCEVIPNVKSKMFNLTDNLVGEENLNQIFKAVASNPNIQRWNFAECGIGHVGGLVVAAALGNAPHVVKVTLLNNKLSAEALCEIVSAAQKRPHLEALKIFDKEEVSLTEAALTGIMTLRRAFPKVTLAFGSMGRIMDASVAMRTIKNPETKAMIKSLQNDLHDAVTRNDAAREEQSVLQLRQISTDEHNRLEGLLTLLMDKYQLLNGFQFVEQLKSFRKYAHEGANIRTGQPLPEHLLAQPQEYQLCWLLSKAAYMEPSFRAILVEVVDVVNSVIDTPSLGNVMRTFELEGTSIELPAVRITGCTKNPDLNGVYVCSGRSEGKFVFCKTGVEGKPSLYLDFRDKKKQHFIPVGWAIDETVNGSWPLGVLRAESGGPSDEMPAEQGWEIFDNPDGKPGEYQAWLEKDPMESKATKHCVPLPDALDTYNGSSRCLLNDNLKNILLKHDDQEEFTHKATLKFGPPKGLDRAREKGLQSLIDLNRATVTVDQPATLLLVYHVLCGVVQQKGGQVTGLKNKFFLDKLTQPPNLHINIEIEGWIQEVQVTLADFILVKKRMHKYYEINRASGTAADLMMPIFAIDKEPLSMAPGAVQHPILNAGKSSYRQQLFKNNPSKCRPSN